MYQMYAVFNKKEIKYSIKGYENAQEELKSSFPKTKLKSLTYLSEWGLHRDVAVFKNASSGQVRGEKEELVKAKLHILVLFPCQP